MTGIRDVPFGLPVGMAEFLQELKNAVESQGDAQAAIATQVGAAIRTVVEPGDTGDFTKPADVSNLQAIVGQRFIALTWDIPSPNNISYTEIWRATDTNIANAVHVGSSPFGFYQDNVGYGSPEYHYWARHVRANVNSPVYGDWAGPVTGQTLPQLADLLDLLEGQLSENQLVQDLNSRIDLIDTPATGLLDQVATEVQQRINDINALSSQIQTIVATSGVQFFVQGTEPADSPPGTIADGARWWDSSDGNRPYIWDDTIDQWVDISDQRIVGNIAAIQTAMTAIADLDAAKAEASVVTTLQTTVGANTTLLTEHASVIDGVEGEYFVKIDANGHVSGFGLYADEQGSAFVVAADVFAVGRAGFADQPLFAVGQIGGIDAIVLNAATFVEDLSITNAMIESVAADRIYAETGTLAEALIGVGHIQNAMISNVIQSDDWNDTTKQGWRLTKDLGLLEGQGITIYDGTGTPIFGTGTGFNLNWVHINGANRPEDNATEGATYGENLRGLPVFEESFDSLGGWQVVGGPGSISVVSDAEATFGGKALQATGYVYITPHHSRDLPFDPSAVYEFRLRCKDMDGTNFQLFAGFAGLDQNKQLVNRNGDAFWNTQHFIAASAVNPSSLEYREYVGYLSGHGDPIGAIGGNSLGAPGSAHEDVRYLRPLLYLNYSGGTTERMRVDQVIVRRVQPQITNANISTYIASASISNLFIGDNQITVPVVSQGGWNLEGNDGFQFVTAIGVRLAIPGAILVRWNFEQGYGDSRGTHWGYRLRFNGVTRRERVGMRAVNDMPGNAYLAKGVAGLNIFELWWHGFNNQIHLGYGTLEGLAVVK